MSASRLSQVVQDLGRAILPAADGASDGALLQRFVDSRDESAFAAIVRRHGGLVWGVCRRVLGRHHDAEDAFQATFLVLARRAASIRTREMIGSWLYGVAYRTSLKAKAAAANRQRRERQAPIMPEPMNSTQDPLRQLEPLLDHELARLPDKYRVAIILCDLQGKTGKEAARQLKIPQGTLSTRLRTARGLLARRLERHRLVLSPAAIAALMSVQATAAPSVVMTSVIKAAPLFAAGQAAAPGLVSAKVAALTEGMLKAMLLSKIKVVTMLGLLLGLTLIGGGLMLAGGPGEPGAKKAEPPPAKAEAKPDAAKVGTMWKETFTSEYESSLPVSVAFSADGKTLLTGDTNGEVMATDPASDPPTYRWKSKADGSHAAVAYSADQKHVYATTTQGVRILDASTGKDVARIDAPDSNPIAIGVFPNKAVAENSSRLQIVFGNARGYFVKSWAEEGKLADTIGTIETSTVAKDVKPTDVAAVPLAVDPKGRSAIMTGPRDAKTNKNVLWAYVCGDYEKDSPGNRVMVGHSATVVSAAWAKEGATAVTGDADGRVIVWDAKTMKESRRIELGGRVLAVAVSGDGAHIAAQVRGKQGAEVYVWETAKPANALRPIHNQPGDFGSEPHASLTFSTDGKRLAGCVIDKKWLQLVPKPVLLSGQVHVWELAAEPKAQPSPKHLYTKQLPKGASTIVIVNNYTYYTLAAKEGAIDFHDIRDGHIQARIGLGKFAIGEVKLSSDRKWLAMEQHAVTGKTPAETFEIGVYEWLPQHKATIPSCSQLLDVASGGKVVAVVRDKQIELWDTATVKKLKAAPFNHTRIDVAQFSPDGKLLAISDRNELVLWRWEENTHERIDLGRRVGSLTFTPDGKFLAEGPTPGDTIQVRDLGTRKVMQTLANAAKRSMNVPRMAFTQGGRVLIACDNIINAKEVPAPHRINIWDTASGSIAHQIALPAGLPNNIDITPNGRYLAAMLDDGDGGMKLSVWRLDGQKPVTEPGTLPPAARRPQ